ncbi:MAG: DNA (cytosine-5-)-methyltransferase [Caldisericia bacterium]|nr:DNA (cytosine-5-)-methyltransferase [Caldisericia bacterium]
MNKKSKSIIKGTSLFANIGISETYFKRNGIDIVLANELIQKRCDFYRFLYPDVEMVCGDINDEKIFKKLVSSHIKKKADFLIATPPCQGMSIAGKMDPEDPRNKLIIQVIQFIKETRPANILIENVPGMIKFSIIVNDKPIKIVDYIKENLEPLGYIINYNVLDAADYGTAQYRKRAIFLISKIKKWDFPKKMKHITVREVIGDLPSLESGEISGIKYHSAKKHNPNHILWMKHTPTGKTAFENPIYYPQKDNRRIKGYPTTYKRIDWDRPSPTVTMCNGAISSQNNVHPGRLKEDGTYSDARVLTILEILRIMGLPDDWPIPNWASDNFIRQVIGEGFPPKFAESCIKTMPRND